MIEDIKYKLNLNNSEKPSGQPQASVLIAILNYGKFSEAPEIIYTQRSSNLSTHSGEVSFPGGKADKTDKNLYETALRESNEEVSLKSKDVTELGKLIDMNVRLKNELNVDSRSYWKNTHKALGKISERLVKLANKVGKLQ